MTFYLGFIFGFSFLDICFNLTSCHKKTLVESSFLTRDQVLSLWSGSTDSKTLLLLLSRFSRVWLCATPYTAAHQAPLSLGFSRQEYCSGLPFPPPMHESEKWKWSCSVVSDSLRPHESARQAFLSITNSWSLLNLMPIKSVMPSSHLILCCPLLLLPPIPPSIRVFSNESALCMRWPNYWSFSFSIRPSSEHQGQISFRMDWLDLLAVQGTLKSLL